MLQKTRGIIFHQLKYSETSSIIKIYTEKFGIQSYMVRGVRKKKSKSSSAIYQHLNLVELEASNRLKKDLQYIKEIKIIFPYKSIPFEIRKSTILVFINEILYQVVREEEPNIALFNFLLHALQFLDLMEKHIASFHFTFLIHLTRYLGFYPQNNYSDSNVNFDLQEGIFTSISGPEKYFATEPLSSLISVILKMKLEDTESLSIPNENRNQLLDTILNYYSLHIPEMRTIKSFDVLKSVFD